MGVSAIGFETEQLEQLLKKAGENQRILVG
jgi:hypothetical protein